MIPCFINAETTVKVVFENWPPYQFEEDGKVVGIDTEVLVEAFRRMDVTPLFQGHALE